MLNAQRRGIGRTNTRLCLQQTFGFFSAACDATMAGGPPPRRVAPIILQAYDGNGCAFVRGSAVSFSAMELALALSVLLTD